MGEFGWAYLNDVVSGQGVEGAVQYASGASGLISGSEDFVYDTTTSTLLLTGSMIISGTLQAHTFDIIHTNKIELEASGSSNFGNDSTDNHIFTGSVYISGGLNLATGGLSLPYKRTTSEAFYSASVSNAIIGHSGSGYIAITLPSASVAGVGKTLIIKDEFNATRTEATMIAVSASTGDKIDHATSYSITGDNAALTLYSDGVSNWFIY